MSGLVQRCGKYEFTTRALPYTQENVMGYQSALPGWEAAWTSVDATGIFVVYRRSAVLWMTEVDR